MNGLTIERDAEAAKPRGALRGRAERGRVQPQHERAAGRERDGREVEDGKETMPHTAQFREPL